MPALIYHFIKIDQIQDKKHQQSRLTLTNTELIWCFEKYTEEQAKKVSICPYSGKITAIYFESDLFTMVSSIIPLYLIMQ